MVESVEITISGDIVTPERLAKGDLLAGKNHLGVVYVVVPKTLTILKDLIRRGVFPPHYEIYALGFMELKNAFLSPMAPKSAAILLEQWGVGVSRGSGDSVYLSIARRMGAGRLFALQYLIDHPERRKRRGEFVQGRKNRRISEDETVKYWQNILEKLIETMDEEREKLFLLNEMQKKL